MMATELEKKQKVVSNKCTEIVNSLIAIRQKQGVSTYTLAERTGIAQSNITRMETGRANPGLETMIRIAEALNADITVSERS